MPSLCNRTQHLSNLSKPIYYKSIRSRMQRTAITRRYRKHQRILRAKVHKTALTPLFLYPQPSRLALVWALQGYHKCTIRTIVACLCRLSISVPQCNPWPTSISTVIHLGTPTSIQQEGAGCVSNPTACLYCMFTVPRRVSKC